jgi:hypothetical protein
MFAGGAVAGLLLLHCPLLLALCLQTAAGTGDAEHVLVHALQSFAGGAVAGLLPAGCCCLELLALCLQDASQIAATAAVPMLVIYNCHECVVGCRSGTAGCLQVTAQQVDCMLLSAQLLSGTVDAQHTPGRPICPVTALAFRFDSAITPFKT